MFLHAVAECESNFTLSTMVCNLAGITLQVVPLISQCYGCSTVWISFYVVCGDEFRDTQITEIWIDSSMMCAVCVFAVCSVQFTICIVQCVCLQWTVCSVQFEICIVQCVCLQCALCSVQFALCFVQCAVGVVRYAVCSVQLGGQNVKLVVFSVQCTVFNVLYLV